MNIYEYDDLSNYLRDSFYQRLDNNPNLSLKAFANKIGISSSSAFNQMLRGLRPVPAKFIPQFALELKLDLNETVYFNELYLKSKSKDSKKSKILLNKNNPKNWREKIFIKPSFTSPLVFVLKTFSKRNITLTENNLNDYFSNTVDREELLKAYKEHSENASKPITRQREVTRPDTKNINIKNGHKFFLELAKASLDTTKIEQREYNSYSINIKQEQIPEIKERIRFFLDSMIENYGNDLEADATYQLGGYFYPLTKKSDQ